MGGYNSGRFGGRPTADMSLRIDIAWMLRQRLAVDGSIVSGSLNWHCGGEPAGTIGYRADMSDPDAAMLRMDYVRGTGDDRRTVRQDIELIHTQPHYGGRRWWIRCPVRHIRVGKLYLPNGGDIFASRKAWRLNYHSQRIASGDRALNALFRLQKKHGCHEGWEAGLHRPKGMWHRTFERHWDEYIALDEQCSAQMAGMILRLKQFAY